MGSKRQNERLGRLRRQQGLIKVADGMHFDPQALADLETRVVAALQGGARMTASELKAIAGGVARKWAIPLFEYLNESRVTIRQGDLRVLHPARKK